MYGDFDFRSREASKTKFYDLYPQGSIKFIGQHSARMFNCKHKKIKKKINGREEGVMRII